MTDTSTLSMGHDAIHITDVEAAINWWRQHDPHQDGVGLGPALQALAEVYALMVYQHDVWCSPAQMSPAAWQAWLDWYDSTPDAPCIAICSTTQGDQVCKGCGRTFAEVQHWLALSPVQKRFIWHRITQEGTAWRFNRYAERVRPAVPRPPKNAAGG